MSDESRIRSKMKRSIAVGCAWSFLWRTTVLLWVPVMMLAPLDIKSGWFLGGGFVTLAISAFVFWGDRSDAYGRCSELQYYERKESLDSSRYPHLYFPFEFHRMKVWVTYRVATKSDRKRKRQDRIILKKEAQVRTMERSIRQLESFVKQDVAHIERERELDRKIGELSFEEEGYGNLSDAGEAEMSHG